MAKQTEAACGDLCGVYAAPHPHAQETAYRHVEDVAKKDTCTSKQTLNNNATTKQQLQLKPLCAALETSTSQKDREHPAKASIELSYPGNN